MTVIDLRHALVRHGRTRWNTERRLQGRADNPLNRHGLADAHAAAGKLAEGGWRRVIASPLRRAQQTGEIIAEELGLELSAPEPLLLERDYGAAEGSRVAEAGMRWPNGDFPGGESVPALTERSCSALRILFASEEPTIFVGHGAFLRAGLASLTGQPVSRILNGQVIVVPASLALGTV